MAVSDIAYVVFDHTDLQAVERFYTDFGLTLAYRTEQELAFRPALARGYSYIARKAAKNGLVAIGMSCPSVEDLQRAAQFPEAGSVEKIDRPGGGWKVRLLSPDGLPFELTHGIEPYPELPVRSPLRLNNGRTKTRHGEWQRPEFEPATALRLGHVALLTTDFKANAGWLASRFGMAASDMLCDKSSGEGIGGFFHCTGVTGWTDHHTLALFPGDQARVHHCSFEIEDLDAQFIGNKWMASHGWKHAWGVGRHILGSQVFDYWLDPAGNLVEHFTDSDLVRPGTPAGFHRIDDNALAMWGPPMEAATFIGMAARHG